MQADETDYSGWPVKELRRFLTERDVVSRCAAHCSLAGLPHFTPNRGAPIGLAAGSGPSASLDVLLGIFRLQPRHTVCVLCAGFCWRH